MKRILVVTCVFSLVGPVMAQESEVTTVTTTEAPVGGVDLLSPPLWNMEDATPLDTNRVDLRLGFRWVTSSAPANWGDSDDDFVLEPTIVWGCYPNVQLSLSTPIWLGDGGDRPGMKGYPGGDDDGWSDGGGFLGFGDDWSDGLDGNADTYLGVLWRIYEQQSVTCAGGGCIPLPSVALSGTMRVPTGCDSNGVDGELRLILTNEYDSGIRSHINGFVKTVNGDNDVDPEDFQWGVVLGADGPLCADGAVRWVADYMLRSPIHDDADEMNIFELGWEWEMADVHKLGMSMQIGLDDEDDTPNFGAGLTYAYSIAY